MKQLWSWHWIFNNFRSCKGSVFVLPYLCKHNISLGAFFVLNPYLQKLSKRISSLMVAILTAELESQCKHAQGSACFWGCWQVCTIQFQQNLIYQSALCFWPPTEFSLTTAQLNILPKSLSLSHRISSFCSHRGQRTSEMLFFISLALLEISLGQFVDFSLHIEFDNFTARCWRQDHLLINLGQTAISSLFFPS